MDAAKTSIRITHMGNLSILTLDQQYVLDQVRKETAITEHFYFTGGTALAECYLHHRYSDDIDLFTVKPFENLPILNFINEIAKGKYTVESRFSAPLYTFMLRPMGGDVDLKVDFSRYPYTQLEEPKMINNIPIDSLIDISTNKLLTISQRTSVKDFVDLYFLLQTHSVYDLMEGVKVKFGIKIEPFFLATDFLKVDSFTFLPRMIKPLTLIELQTFFRSLAVEVSKQVIEE